MFSTRESGLPETRREKIMGEPLTQLEFASRSRSAVQIVKELVLQSPFLMVAGSTAALDNSASCRYILVSIPAGLLSQDMLSLGGSFIGGTV